MADIFLISSVRGEVVQHAIFIHGLGGAPYGTWKAYSESKEYILKWLAEDIEGLAVWTVGYEAAVSRWGGFRRGRVHTRVGTSFPLKCEYVKGVP